MSDKKQSSVDWLVNHWKKLQSEDAKMSWNQIIEITELVKVIHEQEIMKAVDRGFDEGCKFPEDITLSNSRQYYNETFGKDE